MDLASGQSEFFSDLWNFFNLTPYNAQIRLYKPRRPKVFSMWNHHKWLSWLFLLHLNTVTYDMGIFFSAVSDSLSSDSDV